MQDYVNIYDYPSSIVRYQNLVYGDWGNKNVTNGDLPQFENNNDIPAGLQNSGRAMGAYLSICKKLPGTWGVQLNENQNALSPAYGAQYFGAQRHEEWDDLAHSAHRHQAPRRLRIAPGDADDVALGRQPLHDIPANETTAAEHGRYAACRHRHSPPYVTVLWA